jgi:hypothetical protein
MFEKFKKFLSGVAGETADTSFSDDFDSGLSEETASLLRALGSGKLSDAELLDLAKQHIHDDLYECEVCSELDESGEDSLFEQIFENSRNPSTELLTVLAQNFESGDDGPRAPFKSGSYESVMIRFLTHPNSSYESLMESAGHFDWYFRCDLVYGDIEGLDDDSSSNEAVSNYLVNELATIFRHPKSDEAIVASWRDVIHEQLLEVGICNNEPSTCGSCNSFIEIARQTHTSS